MADENDKNNKDVEKIYEIVEKARDSGKIRKGTNEVTKSLEKATAKLVITAKDVNPPEIIMHIPLLAKEKGIKHVEVPSKEELGAAAGLSVPTSCVSIIEEGDAKDLIKQL